MSSDPEAAIKVVAPSGDVSAAEPLRGAMMLWLERRLPTGSVRARLVQGTLWTGLSTALSQALAMATSILTARPLGTAAFGQLGMIRTTIVMFGVVGGTGLGIVATKYLAEYREKDPARAGRLLGLVLEVAIVVSSIAAIACLVLATPLAHGALNAPTLDTAIRIASALIVLQTLNVILLGAVVGLEGFRRNMQLNVMDAVLNLGCIPAGAILAGVNGALVGSVAALAVGVLVKVFVLRAECRNWSIVIGRQGSRADLRQLWTFVLPAMLLGISFHPLNWLARLLIVRQPGGFAEMGFFSAAFAWSQVVLLLPQQVSGPSMVILTDLYSKGDYERFRKLVRAILLMSLGLGGLLAIGMALFSRPIMGAYGREYRSAGLTLAVLASASAIGAGTMAFSAIFNALGKMWWQAFHLLIFGLALIVLTITMVREGALGLAWAYFWAYAVFFAAQWLFSELWFRRRRQQSNESSSDALVSGAPMLASQESGNV